MNSRASACCHGFSLLEICIVLIVISVLTYLGHQYYFSAIEKSKAALIKYQSSTFSRSVENLYGQAQLTNAKTIKLGNTLIYFNEKGWPATADIKTSVKSYNQTVEECVRLWRGLFSNPPSIGGRDQVKKTREHVDFVVSSVNGRICRYEIARETDEKYFFDYDLVTGAVKAYSPN